MDNNVPSVPLSTQATYGLMDSSTHAAQPAVISGPSFIDENTLDEPLWSTIKRDIITIGRNLRSVLIPVKGQFSQQDAALRNWDLWGPLIFMLALCITLSAGQKDPSSTFSLVFVELGFGACILTINVILLGGNIVFFQSLCLLGYCLFPINIAAVVCTLVSNGIARAIVLVASLGWASLATLPFIGHSVPTNRKALAVYPVLLMYASIGWIALVS